MWFEVGAQLITLERSSYTRSLAAAFALLVLAPACARHRHTATSSAVRVPEGEVALRVDNHHWLDVVIYVLHDGQRTRIGIVTATSSETFIFPARLLGQAREIQLLGDAIGEPGGIRTETLVIQPGQYIEWTLESDLRRSSVGVY